MNLQTLKAAMTKLREQEYREPVFVVPQNLYEALSKEFGFVMRDRKPYFWGAAVHVCPDA